jgi:hypothetical protein
MSLDSVVLAVELVERDLGIEGVAALLGIPVTEAARRQGGGK